MSILLPHIESRLHLSSRKIEAQLHVGHATVDRIRLNFCPEVHKRCVGRPVKLTSTEKRKLVRAITSGKADTAAQLER